MGQNQNQNSDFQQLIRFVTGQSDQKPAPSANDLKTRISSSLSIGMAVQSTRTLDLARQLSQIDEQLMNRIAEDRLTSEELMEVRSSMVEEMDSQLKRTAPHANLVSKTGTSTNHLQQIAILSTNTDAIGIPRANNPLPIESREKVRMLALSISERMKQKQSQIQDADIIDG